MGEQDSPSYEFGRFRLDPVERVLLEDGRPLSLTPKALETLLFLVEHRGHIVEKDDLLKRVWPDTFVEEGIIAQNVSALRKALDDTPEGQRYIETVPKRGYRFKRLLAKKSTFAGRSASRLMRYRYHSGPNGVATRTP